MRRIGRVIAGGALLAALAGPAQGAASMTIGSNLSSLPTAGFNCSAGGQCTVRQSTLDPALTAKGGLTSPVNGTVTAFRVRTGALTQPVSLRVLQPPAGGLTVARSGSTPVTPVANTISPFPVSQPIAIGDSIGIDCCQGTHSVVNSSAASTFFNYFFPVLPNNSGQPPTGNTGAELLINADIEPSSAFTVDKPKRKGHKVKFTFHVPNPGQVSIQLAPGGQGKKKGFKWLGPAFGSVSDPGATSLKARLTDDALDRVAEKGRFKFSAVLFFDPTFGETARKSVKVKLKR